MPNRYRRIIYQYVLEFIRNFLNVARITAVEETFGKGSGTRFTTGVKFYTQQQRTRGVLTATGNFNPLGRTPFDEEITIPADGIKPKNAKALRLEKPEGIVFRSRTYTKFAGQTLRREGFLDEALRRSFGEGSDENRGRDLTNDFLRDFARGITIALARHFAGIFRRAGFRVTVSGF